MNSGGDVLARGGKTANFAGAGSITQFEDDMIFRPEIVAEKYGLSQEEIDKYEYMRQDKGTLPDLPTVAQKQAKLFTTTDRRLNFEEVKPVTEEKEFTEPVYEAFHPILDRVLVMRVPASDDLEFLEDGSARNKKTGLIVAAKYRQHSNKGIVLRTGTIVGLGMQVFPVADFVKVKDKVTFGDYNSEIFPMDENQIKAICKELKVNYYADPQGQGIRVVRVQDIRGVERPEETNE